MKSCEKCIWRRYDQTLEKLFKCKLQDKHYDHPKIHGWLCRHYKNKMITNDAYKK